MSIEVDTVTAPAYWASALINGDESGMEDHEIKAMEMWLKGLGDFYVVDVARDEAGESQEARFTWSYELYGGTAQGGDVLDYVVHRIVKQEAGAA
ncbi:hypothetical protein KEU06_09430 [Pseudaminobacter sp. 19-2017]|uniref:Uncharacterized protein n=1 Tax=Pseudaminobacter soli (ex Zhang et al. 2022) TaxID=2831468 RepID=A0A942DWZ4_9HYPH|nr:hypothetical protein [Pseudaminobacter soli]MBS3648826.1 hypothetical protein [Pseudaminobacter soli]